MVNLTPLMRRPKRPDRDGVLSQVGACGNREAATGAIRDLNFVFPGQVVFSCHEIVHVGVRAILCSTMDGNEATMAELINVVLDTPQAASLAG